MSSPEGQPNQKIYCETKEVPPKGANVKIVIKFMRHGQRGNERFELLDIGREITRQKAQNSGIKPNDFDAIKAYGSPAEKSGKGDSPVIVTGNEVQSFAPVIQIDKNRDYANYEVVQIGDKNYRVLGSTENDGSEYINLEETGLRQTPRMMARSLETAHIYKETLAPNDRHVTRPRKLLSYEGMVSEKPYNHVEVYKSNLPADFEELSDDEKIAAAKVAQAKTGDVLYSLQTPEAMAYKLEMAGRLATFVNEFSQMTGKIDSGKNILALSGSHGSYADWILQQALSWTDANGTKRIGFNHIREIGGDLNPSEAFNVIITTDQKGDLHKLGVTFDDPSRPQGEMYLDQEKINQLIKYNKKLRRP